MDDILPMACKGCGDYLDWERPHRVGKDRYCAACCPRCAVRQVKTDV